MKSIKLFGLKNAEQKKKVVIFDFDGTIADDFQLCVDILNKSLKGLHQQPLSRTEIAEFRGMEVKDILGKMSLGTLAVPFIIKHVKDELAKQIETVKPFPGTSDLIKKLKRRGWTTAIVSSNDEEAVRTFLDFNDLDKFDYIHCGGDILGKHRLINALLKKIRVKKDNVVYVGDEVRDIDAALKANIKIISVAWGFNSWEILSTANPNYLVENTSQLAEALKSVLK